MANEYTLVLIKPDAIRRKLIGPVLTKLEEARLSLIASRLRKVDMDLAKKHYAQHEGKHFYDELMKYITGQLHGGNESGVLSLVYEGKGAIKSIRDLAGNTNPEKAEPTTIRGMFGRITTGGLFENVIHASASPIEAEREIKLWFEPGEMLKEIYPTSGNGTTKSWKRIPELSELHA